MQLPELGDRHGRAVISFGLLLFIAQQGQVLDFRYVPIAPGARIFAACAACYGQMRGVGKQADRRLLVSVGIGAMPLF
ncbi:MAG: hypothetical protein KBA71_07850 [Opitutaceae bacterium]|nr:hypothetical protein [Opitutaceae bacterium]